MRPARTEPWQAMVAERGAQFRQLGGKVREQCGSVGIAERGRCRPDEHRLWSEPLDLETEGGEGIGGGFESVAIRLVEVDHLGDEQGLTRDFSALPGAFHPLEHQSFVGGVLIDDDQSVLGFGDNISRGDLAAGDPERESRDRRGSGFGAGLRCQRRKYACLVR